MLHDGGPAALRGENPPDGGLSDDLRAALREWSEAAGPVLRSGDVHELDVLRQRGRQLAFRVSGVLGRPVEFVDPLTGEVESIRAGAAGAATNGGAPLRTAVDGIGDAADASAPRPALGPEPPGPTPWGTGLAVTAFFAVLVAVADVVLTGAFAGAFGLLWIPANLLVTAGTLPSLWLAREVPFWRWPAFGAAAGLAAAWVVMLLGLLAP